MIWEILSGAKHLVEVIMIMDIPLLVQIMEDILSLDQQGLLEISMVMLGPSKWIVMEQYFGRILMEEMDRNPFVQLNRRSMEDILWLGIQIHLVTDTTMYIY